MNMPPEPPPEGVLIESARRDARLSVREAARRAGISEGWWRQVVKGFQSLSGGAHGAVRDVPADTVARMAAVVGVTAGRMETEGQRPDAAEIMRHAPEIRPGPPAPLSVVAPPPASLDPGPDDVFPDADAEVRARVDAELPALRMLYRQAAIRGPVTSGADIFTSTPHEAERWDRLAEAGYMEKPCEGYSLAELFFLMGMGRVFDAEYRAAAGHPARSRNALTSVT